MLGRAPIVRIQTAPQKMIDANQGRANALTHVFRPAKGDRWAARRAGGRGGREPTELEVSGIRAKPGPS
jgi:hypothetical protein